MENRNERRQLPSVHRGAPILKQVQGSLSACPFCGHAATLELHSHDEIESVTHFTIGCGDSGCIGSHDPTAFPIDRLLQMQASWNSRSDQASHDVSEHFGKFLGFAVTCRRENTYEWMRLMADWLNGAAARLYPGTYFEMVGADHFVVRKDSPVSTAGPVAAARVKS